MFLRKGLVIINALCLCCLRRGELGHGLGPLGYSVLCKLTGKHEAHSSLDLSGRKCCLLAVSRELTSLAGDALKDIVDERVHDAHPLLADAGVRVDLLEDFVYVGRVGLDTPLAALLLAVHGDLSSLGGRLLGWCFSHGFG